MDLIFIDGGHTIETINNDWKYCQKLMDRNTVVIFDDYWNIVGSGCKPLIDSLDKNKFEVTILEPKDCFKKSWGILETQMVRVEIKNKNA